jgi:hypothetical protein
MTDCDTWVVESNDPRKATKCCDGTNWRRAASGETCGGVLGRGFGLLERGCGRVVENQR